MIDMKRVVPMAVVSLLAFALVITTTLYERNVYKGKVLFYELQAVRTAVNLFKAINQRNPEDMNELLTGEFSFPGEGRKHRFFDIPGHRAGGNLMDPFGNPYAYDSRSGWVKSETVGYELW